MGEGVAPGVAEAAIWCRADGTSPAA